MKDFSTSILVPTYNRANELNKLIHYAASNFDLSAVRFIVLDGSDNEKETNRNQSICVKNKIDYHYFGPEITFYQRIIDGLETVNTGTVILLGDDDILDPNGVTDCVKFLDTNDDYAIAHGKYIGFNCTPNGTNFNETYISKSIEHDSPLERLFHFFSNYTAPTFYAVNRTLLLKKSFEELKKNFSSGDYVISEIIVSAIPLIKGKLKRLDSFFQARRFQPATKNKYVVYAKYIMENDFSNKMKRIKKCILKNMADKEKVKDEIFLDAIDYTFASLFGHRLNQQEISQRFCDLEIK